MNTAQNTYRRQTLAIAAALAVVGAGVVAVAFIATPRIIATVMMTHHVVVALLVSTFATVVAATMLVFGGNALVGAADALRDARDARDA